MHAGTKISQKKLKNNYMYRPNHSYFTYTLINYSCFLMHGHCIYILQILPDFGNNFVLSKSIDR